MDLLLTGRWVTADEAWAMGLVSRVVDDDALAPVTEEIAREVSQASPTAVAEIKRLVSRAYGAPGDGLELEIDAVMRRFESPEFVLAMEEFRRR